VPGGYYRAVPSGTKTIRPSKRLAFSWRLWDRGELKLNFLESGKDDLADGFATLNEEVRLLHMGGIDSTEIHLHGGLNPTSLHQDGNFVEEAALFIHVGRLIT
jgi:hypothetical protein